MHCAFSRGEIQLAVSKWLVILHKCRKKVRACKYISGIYLATSIVFSVIRLRVV